MLATTTFHSLGTFLQENFGRMSPAASLQLLVFFTLLWQSKTILISYLFLRPVSPPKLHTLSGLSSHSVKRGIKVASYPTLFGQWLTSLRYHIVALDLIWRAYRGVNSRVPAMIVQQI